MAVDLVIFDWDGTLIDSTDRIADCLLAAAHEVGAPPLARERYRSIIGLGLPEALRDLYPEADESILAGLRAAYARFYIDAERDPCRPYAGAVELLETLLARGMRLAVATGKNRPGLDRAFAGTGLRDYFAVTRTADETRSKPHPRMLLEILADQRVSPERALMIGDTGFDLEMARHAGVPSIGMTHGAHAPEELLRHEPLALADHLLLVPGLIDEKVPHWRAARKNIAAGMPT